MNFKIFILLSYICFPVLVMTQTDSLKLDQLLHAANQNLEAGNYAAVDSLANLIVSDAEALRDKNRQAQAWELLGQSAIGQDQYEDAHRHLQNAKSCWTSLQDLHKIGAVCKEIAGVWDAVGNYPEQLKIAEHGLRIFEQLQDEAWIGKLMNCVANAHKNMGNNGLAITHYGQALQKAKEANDVKLQGVVQYNLGELYYQIDELDLADELMREAERNFIAIQDFFSLSVAYNVLGAIAYDKKFDEIAKEKYVQSAELAKELGVSSIVFDAYLNIAELEIEQGDLKAATLSAQQAELHLGKSDSRMDEKAYQSLQSSLHMALAERQTYRLRIAVQWLYFILIALAGYLYIYRGLQKQKQAEQELQVREIQGQKRLELKELEAKKALELKKKEDEMRLAAEKSQIEHRKHVQQLITYSTQQANAVRLKTMQEERKVLAERVHGNISSQLVAARWLINNFKEKLEKQAVDTEDMIPIVTRIKTTYESSRNVEDLLEHLPLNYATEIENFLQPLCQSTEGKPKINFSSSGLERGLSAEIGFNVYEIVQMATANTLSHAEANEFNCQINLLEDELVLLLEDDGKGFTVPATPSGSGLRNMVTLVGKMKGKIDIHSAPNRGTHITITIPVNTELASSLA